MAGPACSSCGTCERLNHHHVVRLLPPLPADPLVFCRLAVLTRNESKCTNILPPAAPPAGPPHHQGGGQMGLRLSPLAEESGKNPAIGCALCRLSLNRFTFRFTTLIKLTGAWWKRNKRYTRTLLSLHQKHSIDCKISAFCCNLRQVVPVKNNVHCCL